MKRRVLLLITVLGITLISLDRGVAIERDECSGRENVSTEPSGSNPTGTTEKKRSKRKSCNSGGKCFIDGEPVNKRVFLPWAGIPAMNYPPDSICSVLQGIKFERVADVIGNTDSDLWHLYLEMPGDTTTISTLWQRQRTRKEKNISIIEKLCEKTKLKKNLKEVGVVSITAFHEKTNGVEKSGMTYEIAENTNNLLMYSFNQIVEAILSLSKVTCVSYIHTRTEVMTSLVGGLEKHLTGGASSIDYSSLVEAFKTENPGIFNPASLF